MPNSVSPSVLDPHARAGVTTGAFDGFDYVDGVPGLVPHLRPQRVPRGAPVAVAGWAAIDADGGRPAAAVAIVLDGARAFAAQTGISRRDISSARPGIAEKVGYRATVATGDLTPGGHEIRAFALGSEGAWYEVGYLPFWVAAVPLFELTAIQRRLQVVVDQIIDLAADGTPFGVDRAVACGRFALLSGWGIEAATRRGVAGVVAVDSRGGRWSAPCDVVRPDLKLAFGTTDDRFGFEIVVPADALGRGRHVLTLSGFDAAGRTFACAGEVTVDVAGPARRFPAFPRVRKGEAPGAVGVTPTAADGTVARTAIAERDYAGSFARGTVLQFDGWALDREGRGAGTVFVELKPAASDVPPHRFAALAGFRLDDPPGTLAPPPQDDAWFSARVDTAHLPPREYALALAVFDADRRSYTRRELGRVTVGEPAGGSASGTRRT
jgi:hypothetical protein